MKVETPSILDTIVSHKFKELKLDQRLLPLARVECAAPGSAAHAGLPVRASHPESR